MKTLIKNYSKIDIFIVLACLASSGFPSFLSFQPFLFLLLPICLYLIKVRKIQFQKSVITTILVITVFAVLHFILGHRNLIGTIDLILRFSTIIVASVLVGTSFRPIFIYLMKFFSYVSVIIWCLIFIFPSFANILFSIGSALPQFVSETWLQNTTTPGVSLYLYYLPEKLSSSYMSFFRNCGPFFEPGLFASYLSLAIALNMGVYNSLFNKDNIILLLALLSTCSSAGYISLLIILISSLFFSKSIFYRVVIILTLVLCWNPIMNLDFMSEKISTNFESADSSASSRFGAVLYHLEKLSVSPLIGYAGGDMPLTRFDSLVGNYDASGLLSPNGVSFPFLFWGVPLGIVFFALLFRSIQILLPQTLPKYKLLLLFIILLSASFSQTITTNPLILLMTAVSLTSYNKISLNESRNN